MNNTLVSLANSLLQIFFYSAIFFFFLNPTLFSYFLYAYMLNNQGTLSYQCTLDSHIFDMFICLKGLTPTSKRRIKLYIYYFCDGVNVAYNSNGFNFQQQQFLHDFELQLNRIPCIFFYAWHRNHFIYHILKRILHISHTIKIKNYRSHTILCVYAFNLRA